MRRIILTTIVIIALLQRIYPQVSEGGLPYSFTKDISESIVSYELIADLQNIESNIRTDTIEGETIITFRDDIIGELFPVSINFIAYSSWVSLENGDSLCRLQINSSGGKYMMLIFKNFYLPDGSSLYVYSHDREQVLGAFTSNNNTSQNKLTTTPLRCNSLILEYYKPSYVREQEKLEIESVGLITREFSGILKDIGDSGDCMVNAKCPQYENWCNQRRSIALVIRVLSEIKQIRWCTGSMVTNERRDGKPFFLTAFHCIDNNPENNSITQAEMDDIQNWLFVFNYQSQGCENPLSEPSLIYSISGAAYIKSNVNTDYALLQLNQKPPKNYNVYYNGWSNDKDDMTNSGVCIHHPNGDIKKISEWEKKVSGNSNHWKVKWINGSAEGGSSGAPLFNSNGYVVGQNHYGNGYSVCDDKKRNFFGRFDKSWYKYGLDTELNPNGKSSGTHLISMTGDEVCKNIWYFSNCNDLHTSANVSFLNGNAGTRMYDGIYNAKHSIVAENVIIQENTSVTFEASNEIVLKSGFRAIAGSRFVAKIGNCETGCGNGWKSLSTDENVNESMVISTIPYIEDQEKSDKPIFESENEFSNIIKIYPNPNTGTFTISIDSDSQEIINIQIINVLSNVIWEQNVNTEENTHIILPNPIAGVYFLKAILKERTITKKTVIQ